MNLDSKQKKGPWNQKNVCSDERQPRGWKHIQIWKKSFRSWKKFSKVEKFFPKNKAREHDWLIVTWRFDYREPNLDLQIFDGWKKDIHIVLNGGVCHGDWFSNARNVSCWDWYSKSNLTEALFAGRVLLFHPVHRFPWHCTCVCQLSSAQEV